MSAHMSRRSWSSSLTLLCLAISCGGDAEPTGTQSEPMTLTFEPAVVSRTGVRTTTGTFRCDVDMTILAHGGTDHLVSLQGISTTFTDAAGVPGNTVAAMPVDWFGVNMLKRNETAVTHRQPTGSGPFSMLTTLAYRDQFGTSKTATFALTCRE